MSTSPPPLIAAKLARLPDLAERCHEQCPGWCVMADSEIQVCDQCWDGIPDPLTDREAAEIPAARAELALAMSQAERHRKIERFTRRTVVVVDTLLRSPCCQAAVTGGSRLASAGMVLLTPRGPRVASEATSDVIDEVWCSSCKRMLQMPAGIDQVRVVARTDTSDRRSGSGS